MIKSFLKYPLIYIVVLAILLRLPLISGSFWMDEAAQALEITRPFSQQLDIVDDFQPPLLHLILHFAQYFSWQEWYLRTIGALIPGIISIIFTYKFAEKLFSKNTAIASSVLLATSSFHIYFSQELRPYALPAMLASISMYYFYLFLNEKTKKQKKYLIFIIISNIFGLYSSYLYPFFIIAQIFYSLTQFKKEKFKYLLFSFIISILGFLPILPLFLKQLVQGGTVRTQLPGWDQVVSIPQLKAVPLVFAKLIYGILPIDPNPFIIISTIFIFVTVLSLPFIIKKEQTKKLSLVLTWIMIPILTSWIISFIVPVVHPKRLLFILPALYIMIAELSFIPFLDLIANKKVKIQSKLSGVLFLTIIIINLVSTSSYFLSPKLQRENWRDLAITLHQRYEAESTILIYSFTDEFAPMHWYEQFSNDKFKTFSTQKLFINDVEDLENKIKIVYEYKTVIVFDYLRDLTDPTKKIEINLHNLGYKEVSVLDYPNIGFIRIFMRPDQVIGMTP